MLKIKRGDPFTMDNSGDEYNYIEIEIDRDDEVPTEVQKGNLCIYEGTEAFGDDRLVLQFESGAWNDGDWISMSRETAAKLLPYLERYANGGLLIPDAETPNE